MSDDTTNLPVLHHAKNYEYASDLLEQAAATEIGWDAHSVRVLAKKATAWVEELEYQMATVELTGLKTCRRKYRRPPAKLPRNRVGVVPFVEGVGAQLPPYPVVYFVQGVGTPLVKIGYTTALGARLAVLAINSAVPLRLVYWRRAKSHNCEKELHVEFDEYREHGEWFRREGRIEEFLSKQKSVRRLQRAATTLSQEASPP